MTSIPPRARLGRHPAGQVSFGLPSEWVPLLNAKAAEAGMARSNWLRHIILRELGFALPDPRT